MFVFFDEDDGNANANANNGGGENAANVPLHHHDNNDDDNGHHERMGDEELVRFEMPQILMPMGAAPLVIKINNVLLLLSLVVATFIQYATLEPHYLNALMWGTSNNDKVVLLLESAQNGGEESYLLGMSISTNLHSVMRSLQSMAAIFLLSFLRVAVFPNLSRYATAFEAVLGDMLFHIQCRLVIGFLTCFLTPMLPFGVIETTVVCLSIALQMNHQ